MKIASWNVNGIRSVFQKGFAEWFEKTRADIVCLQEVKAEEAQIPEAIRNPLGFHRYWYPAKKKGYSGVAIYSRLAPHSVSVGLGVAAIDCEGRVLQAEYDNFFLLSCYFPNSQRGGFRLPYKLLFCEALLRYVEKLRARKKHVIVCGDINIAHTEIDLKNPKANQDNAGFLPEERDWLGGFLNAGYTDCFRHFNQDPEHYTWWSYRPTIRERNIGWRIDHFFCDQAFNKNLVAMTHQTSVLGSDHCPIVLEIGV